MLWVFLGVAGIVCGAVILFHFTQRRLLYFPTHEDGETAMREARSIGLEPWLGSDGHFLGWKAPHPSGHPAGRLLGLHGNAGTALGRLYLRDVFQSPNFPLALDVFLLEYPGYGPRPSQPSEASLVAAAREGVDSLSQAGTGPLFVLGESLGSATAALVAAERPKQIAGVILVLPLLSVTAVAQRFYPFLPAFLIRDTFHADEALPHYGGPVAFLIAGRDSVVFPDLGERLFTSYPGPKRLWREGDADHNTLTFDPSDPRWAEMVSFLLEHSRFRRASGD